MPGTAFAHGRQRELHAVDDAEQVDLDLPARHFLRLLVEAPDPHDPGVVHEHVERALKVTFGRGDELGEGVAVGDVELEAEGSIAKAGCDLPRDFTIEVAQRNTPAGADELAGGLGPDAAARSGDSRQSHDAPA